MDNVNTPAPLNPTVDVAPPVADESVSVKSSQLPTGPKGNSKLLVVAIIILVISILASVGIYVLRKPKQEAQVMVPEEQQEVKPAALFLTIHSPGTDTDAVNGEILVSGKTLPNTAVLMYSDVDEASVDSDEEGNFEETVVVGESGGVLRITAFGENGEEESKTFQVTESKPVSYAGGEVLGISDEKPGQMKKENDVAQAMEKDKKGPSGTPGKPKPTLDPTLDTKTKKLITDFLEDKEVEKKTVKVGLGKIKQALSKTGTESGELKGLKLKKLAAKTATPGAALKRHAVEGVITALADGAITISHQTQTEKVNTIYYNESTVFHMKGVASPTSANLEVGMRVAAVGEPADDGILAKRIHVIPGLAKGLPKKPATTPSGSVTPSVSASVSATPKVTLTPTVVITVTPTVTANATPTEEPATPTPEL